MAIIYVDPENGNDANPGLSFASRKKSLAAATSGLIAGDEVRVIASPTGEIPNCILKDAQPQNGDSVFGIGTITSTSTTVTWTFTSSNHGFVTGDWIKIYPSSTYPEFCGIFPVTRITATQFSIPNKSGVIRTNVSIATNWYYVNISNAIVSLGMNGLTKAVIWAGDPSLDSHVQYSATPTTSTNVVYSKLYYNSTSNAHPAYGNVIGQLAVNVNFTTGKAAYWTVPNGPMDLSNFSQISFWVRQTSGSNGFTTSNFSIRLCSDTLGNNTVYTIPIYSLTTLNTWVHQLYNIGSNMTTGINSIAFYVDSDIGAITLNFTNVLACLDPDNLRCITGQSLISTKREDSTFGKDPWWQVQTIFGNHLFIGNGNVNQINYSTYGSTNDGNQGYIFSTTTPTSSSYTGTLYTILPVDPFLKLQNRTSDASQSSVMHLIQSSGILVSGGWNRTDMSTKDPNSLSFFYNGSNNYYIGLRFNSFVKNTTVENIGYSCFWAGFYGSSFTENNVFKNICVAGFSGPALSLSSTSIGYYIQNFTACQPNITSTAQYIVIDAICRGVRFEDLHFRGHHAQSSAIQIQNAGDIQFRNLTILGLRGTTTTPSASAIRLGPKTNFVKFENVYVAGANTNRGRLITFNGIGCCYNIIKNVTGVNLTGISSVTSSFVGSENAITDLTTLGVFAGQTIPTNIEGSAVNASKNFTGTYQGNYANVGVSYKPISGIQTHIDYTSWIMSTYEPSAYGRTNVLKFIPLSASQLSYGDYVPIRYRIAKVAVTGGKTVQISGKVYRENPGNNSCPLVRIICKPQLPGISTTTEIVGSDYVSSFGEWTQTTLLINPSISGVIDIELEFLKNNSLNLTWGVTTNIFFDDLTITEI